MTFKKSVLLIPFIGLLFITLLFIKNKNEADTALTQKIFNVLDKYQIAYDIDAKSIDSTTNVMPRYITGIPEFIAQIKYFVVHKQPINMLLVGFPFKSPNHHKKTISSLPDMAERKSLEYLQEILYEIKSVYAPGASITIFCDGVPFASSFGVPLADVITYEKSIQSLATDLPDIKFYTSSDCIQKHTISSVDKINMIIDSYQPDDATFKATAQPISQKTQKRFALELDHPAGKALLLQRSLDDIINSLLAREARLRNYLHEFFPSSKYLRLTVHFSPNANKKFGIRLSPDSCITPYHGVLVEENDGSWSIKFKKDINNSNYALTHKKVHSIDCPYFKALNI